MARPTPSGFVQSDPATVPASLEHNENHFCSSSKVHNSQFLTFGTFAVRIQEDQHLSRGVHRADQSRSNQSLAFRRSQQAHLLQRSQIVLEHFMQVLYSNETESSSSPANNLPHPRTFIREVVDEYHLFQELSRRPVEHRPHRSQQRRARFVVKDDDHRGVRENRNQAHFLASSQVKAGHSFIHAFIPTVSVRTHSGSRTSGRLLRNEIMSLTYSLKA